MVGFFNTSLIMDSCPYELLLTLFDIEVNLSTTVFLLSCQFE